MLEEQSRLFVQAGEVQEQQQAQGDQHQKGDEQEHGAGEEGQSVGVEAVEEQGGTQRGQSVHQGDQRENFA